MSVLPVAVAAWAAMVAVAGSAAAARTAGPMVVAAAAHMAGAVVAAAAHTAGASRAQQRGMMEMVSIGLAGLRWHDACAGSSFPVPTGHGAGPVVPVTYERY